MTLHWEHKSPLRVNRYIDWDTQLKSTISTNDHWVSGIAKIRHESAELESKKRSKGVLTKALNWTLKHVNQAKLVPSIALHTTEYQLLKKLAGRVAEIVDLESDEERLEGFKKLFENTTQFDIFFHMKESEIYEFPNGDSVPHVRYNTRYPLEIRLASPPIVDLDLNFENIARSFDPTYMAQSKSENTVVVAVIDDAIAFANSRFCYDPGDPDGSGGKVPLKSRFLALWQQEKRPTMSRQSGGDPNEKQQFLFGNYISNTDINTLLEKNARDGVTNWDHAIYRDNASVDFMRPDKVSLARSFAHGTHIFDLASGFSPDAKEGLDYPLIGVQLPVQVTHDTSGQSLAFYALHAIRQIIQWADMMYGVGDAVPLVINFSYGFQAGPKDQSSDLGFEIRRMLNARNSYPPTKLILAAGNSYDDRTTAQLELLPCDSEDNKTEKRKTLDWVLLPDDHTESFMEIWLRRGVIYDEKGPIKLHVQPPGFAKIPVPMPKPGDVACLHINDALIAAVYCDKVEPPADWSMDSGSRVRILIAVNRTANRDSRTQYINPAPHGIWKIDFENTSADILHLDMHIQRDDTYIGAPLGGRQSYFDDKTAHDRSDIYSDFNALDPKNCPIKHQNSLSALEGGTHTLQIGSADARQWEYYELAIVMEGKSKEHPYPPSRYSAAGFVDINGPYAAAICDYGPSFPGKMASGVASSSSFILGGTSVAAPQFTRHLAAVGGNLTQLDTIHAPAGAVNSRLGGYTLKDTHGSCTIENKDRLRKYPI